MVRAQYHFRRVDCGVDAGDVRRLAELSQDPPVRMVDPRGFAELDEDHWSFHVDRIGYVAPFSIKYPVLRRCNSSVIRTRTSGIVIPKRSRMTRSGGAVA